MKKLLFTFAIITVTINFASAQFLSGYQFGVKGGANLSGFTKSSSEPFSNSDQFGYIFGCWARFGDLGFNVQPEIYLSDVSFDITNKKNGVTKARYTSVDFPLLFGDKIRFLGPLDRFYTGPLAGFDIQEGQSFSGVINEAAPLHYKDNHFAWQFGAGLDLNKIAIDLRYQVGISKQYYQGGLTRVNMLNLTLSYRLIQL